MLDVLVGTCFIPAPDLSVIRAGDVFRTIDAGMVGPLMIAASDAAKVPHPKDPSRRIWHVKCQTKESIL